jgi:hypothetical protein
VTPVRSSSSARCGVSRALTVGTIRQPSLSLYAQLATAIVRSEQDQSCRTMVKSEG